MTNDEARMKPEVRMTKRRACDSTNHSCFGFRHSFVIRHSCFVISDQCPLGAAKGLAARCTAALSCGCELKMEVTTLSPSFSPSTISVLIPSEMPILIFTGRGGFPPWSST
jgi:hypothetical protein